MKAQIAFQRPRENTPIMTNAMRRMLVKATVTEATDEGTFTAVISSVSIDRDGDIVEPAGVVKALQAWAPLGKMIPLSWDHEYDADFIIGHIVPASVKETKSGEVEADGWIDQSFDRGIHAWRLVKSGTLGFSYGYLIKAATPMPDDSNGLHITELDIFEVTATPIPANADTRVISYKSLKELKEAMAAIEREEEERVIPEDVVDPPPAPPEPEPEPEHVDPPALPNEVLRSVGAHIEREEEERLLPDVNPPPPEPEPVSKVEEPPPKPLPADALRHVATELEREEQERTLPDVGTPPPAPTPRTPPPKPVPLPADTLRHVATVLEREEQERSIPEVDPPPAPKAPPPPPAPPVPQPADVLKTAAHAIEREEAERKIPDVDPPPPPEAHTPPPPPKPKDIATLRAQADALEREEQERNLPEVDPPPPPEQHTPPVEPPAAKDPAVLKAAAAAIEREENDRKIPEVTVTPLPEPEVKAEPPREPAPLPVNSLKKVADAVERAEQERKLPEVDPPPPEPEPVPVPDPEPVLTTDQLKVLTDAVARQEQERKLPEVEVVDAEPVPEDPARLEEFLTGKGVTKDDLLVFARGVLAEHGTSVEALETQVKRLEREERGRKEAAIIQSAEVEGVQAQVAEAREAVVALEHFDPAEVEGMKSGILTTVWTAAYLNDLPDSAFLHVADGGKKGADGKTTPRTLRHFPYKHADGVVDLPHLRNAMVRIPQSKFSKMVQERLSARAQRILDSQTVDATVHEKGAEGHGSRTVDPLRKQADDVALEHFSDGLDRQKPPRKVEQPKQAPEMDLATLKQKMFDETLTLLSD